MCYLFLCRFVFCFFFKQKTAYEMRISDWSADVCSSDLGLATRLRRGLPFCRPRQPDAVTLSPPNGGEEAFGLSSTPLRSGGLSDALRHDLPPQSGALPRGFGDAAR